MYAQSKYSKSIQNFDTAIDLFKDNDKLGSSLSDSFRGRALCNFELDNKNKAISDMSNAIKYDKKNGLLWLTRGNIFYKMGREKKACDDYEKACQLNETRGCEGYNLYCK